MVAGICQKFLIPAEPVRTTTSENQRCHEHQRHHRQGCLVLVDYACKPEGHKDREGEAEGGEQEAHRWGVGGSIS
jgi:hypothetical protein